MSYIPEGFIEATFQHRLEDTNLVADCVIGFRELEDFDFSTIAGDLFNDWNSTVGNFQNEKCILTGVRVVRGPSETAVISDFGGSDSGDDTGSPATFNTAYLVRKNTLLGGRANRGRIFVPGVGENRVDGAGVLDGTFKTAAQGDLDDFLATTATHNVQMCVLHSTSAIPVLNAVVSLTLQDVAATQRDRMRR